MGRSIDRASSIGVVVIRGFTWIFEDGVPILAFQLAFHVEELAALSLVEGFLRSSDGPCSISASVDLVEEMIEAVGGWAGSHCSNVSKVRLLSLLT